MKLEGILNNGEFDGIVHEYYDVGKLLFEGEYKNWSRCDGVILDKNGEIIDELKEGQSLKEQQENNKKIQFEGEYLEGKYWIGKIKEYYDDENKILKFEGEYFNGELNGLGKEYNEKGYLLYEGNYISGEKFGKGKIYYDNGILKYEGDICSSEMQGKGKLYNKKQELIFEGEFYENKIWNGYGKEYFNQDEGCFENNLIIKYEGEYHNGKKMEKEKNMMRKGN